MIRRTGQAALVVFITVTVMFLLFRVMPANPAAMFVQQGASSKAARRLLEQWGLTGPLYDQYWAYLQNIFRLNFGRSFFYHKPVWEILVPRIVNTLWITVPGMILATVVGVAGGMFAGWGRRGGLLDRGGVAVATVIRGVPSFVLGVLLLLLFTGLVDWLPYAGMRETGVAATGLSQYLSLDFLRHLVLPVVTVAIFFIPENLLLMRTGVLESRGEEYVALLRAKGLREAKVMWHAGRNSLLPVVTWMFPSLAETIAGVIVVEVVFSWPGVGRELVLSVTRQDFPVAQASLFLFAVMIVIANLLADLVYSYLDPRVVLK